METNRTILIFCFTVILVIAVGCQAEAPIPTETPTLAQLPEGCPPDCSYADLRGANLSEAKLSETDLRGADLRGADLRGADLNQADLRGANLQGANLNGARLIGADLRGANLEMTDLSETDLTEADLNGADLSGATYDNATMWPANFDPLEADAASQTPLPIPTLSPSADSYEEWIASSQALKANCLELFDSHALSFPTYHVQGLAVSEDTYYVSSVDKENYRAWLFKIARDSLALTEQKELTEGALIHPGGIEMDGTYLWIPNAEYDQDGPTKISALDPQSLQVSRTFDVDDHISLIASNGADRLYGTNWDSVNFYVWDWDGNLIERVASPTDMAYQDCEFVDPYLICGGTKDRGRSGTIDFIDPASWTLVDRIEVGQTSLGHTPTREGLSFFGDRVYLLPEDGPDSEILIYRLCKNP